MKGTKYFESPLLYKENGFKERPAAEQLLAELKAGEPEAVAQAVERKKRKTASDAVQSGGASE